MKQYNATVDADMVLAIAHTLKIPETEVVGFFDGVIEQMYACPPNFTRKPYSKKTEKPIEDKVWLLRGYYPNTGIFFKVTIVQTKNDWSDEESIFSKVRAVTTGKGRHITIDSKEIRRCIAENVLIGEPMPHIDMKPQRLLTPKGMKPFRLNKRK